MTPLTPNKITTSYQEIFLTENDKHCKQNQTPQPLQNVFIMISSSKTYPICYGQSWLSIFTMTTKTN